MTAFPVSGDVSGVRQCGERGMDLAGAWQHGVAAAGELGLTFTLDPVPETDPGAWECVLYRDGRQVPGGRGSGKGDEPAARVGALFEALEHHLTATLPDTDEVVLCSARQIAAGPLRGEAVARLLAEGPDEPLACLPYRSLSDDSQELLVPVFLNVPDYLNDSRRTAAARYADAYPYTGVCRYAMNNGWAAGATWAEALVHALNEIIERDAMSLLLIEQFLPPAPEPGSLRVVEPTALPGRLQQLHQSAQSRLKAPVHLLEATTDLDVPVFWAYTPAPPGTPARTRGAGASLSRAYAAERALSELIQIHSCASRPAAQAAQAARPATGRTRSYPALHRCHLADFSRHLPDATTVAFPDHPTPATPQGHLHNLLHKLARRGYTAYARAHHLSDHLSVCNVIVPGLERFVLVADDMPVLPGTRGNAHHHRPRPAQTDTAPGAPLPAV
ncbi:YcaO-like family protein [Streptomyces sp. NPDC002701]|uniref:YcaO-like family protein n=1 Tax=Streptomyces sp. NPDC002701 TaxID=3364661 RepID=UPI0036ADD1E7